MEYPDFIIEAQRARSGEEYLTVSGGNFLKACDWLHKGLNSEVMMFFAEDLRLESGQFALYCVFLNTQKQCWVIVRQFIPQEAPVFASLYKEIYSASLFEREINEMFGILAQGNPDLRRMRLHDEVWPKGFYPLRKDFKPPQQDTALDLSAYQFKRVEGEGIFEVPVGPVHAGIIGPGHFRFSVAGEPIINLELRLGWTHRGIEKLLEDRAPEDALGIFERVSGDTAFGYSLCFCNSVEKIFAFQPPLRAQIIRVIFLELERLYNHANTIGGIALDVGFSFPAQFASLIKEAMLQLNESLCGSRYLKGINAIGGAQKDIDEPRQGIILQVIAKAEKDFRELEKMLFDSVSFMDRIDATGILRPKTARDIGVTGLSARASGAGLDMRKALAGIYHTLLFKAVKEQSADVAARLKARFGETKESISIIKQCLEKLKTCDTAIMSAPQKGSGFAIGCVEAWRGPILVWVRLDAKGKISRCKIVDPSFHNWEGLCFAVLGNIIPDFPLCNKSFDLSYSGNDL